MKIYSATKPVRVVARSMGVLRKDAWLRSADDFLRRLVDDLAVVSERGLGNDFVAPIELEFLFFQEQLDQVELILRVQLAGVLAQHARHVQRAENRDLADLHRLAGLGVFAVATAFGR